MSSPACPSLLQRPHEPVDHVELLRNLDRHSVPVGYRRNPAVLDPGDRVAYLEPPDKLTSRFLRDLAVGPDSALWVSTQCSSSTRIAREALLRKVESTWCCPAA